MLDASLRERVCRALYNWDAQNPDELSFAAGELITLVTKSTKHDGWWMGKSAKGEGLFPSNYVMEQHIVKPAAPPTTPPTALNGQQKQSAGFTPQTPVDLPPLPSTQQQQKRFEPAPPSQPPPPHNFEPMPPSQPPPTHNFEPAPPSQPPPTHNFEPAPPSQPPPTHTHAKRYEDATQPPSDDILPPPLGGSAGAMPRDAPPLLPRRGTTISRSYSTMQFQGASGSEPPRLRMSSVARPRVNLAASSSVRQRPQCPPKMAERHHQTMARSVTMTSAQMTNALEDRRQRRGGDSPRVLPPKKEVVQTPPGAKMAEAQVDIQGNGGASLSASAGDRLIIFCLESPWCDAYNLSTKSCGNVPRDCVTVFDDVAVPIELEVPTDGSQMLFESFCNKKNQRSGHLARPPAQLPQPPTAAGAGSQEMHDIEKQIKASKQRTQASNEVTKSTVSRMIGNSSCLQAPVRQAYPQQNLQKFNDASEYLFSFEMNDTRFVEKDKSGAVKGATLEYLIKMLTEEHTKNDDILVFVCTYRKYTTTAKILNLLKQRMKFPETAFASKVKAAKTKIFTIVKEMINDKQIDPNDPITKSEHEGLLLLSRQDKDDIIRQLFSGLKLTVHKQLEDIKVSDLDDGTKEIKDVMEIPPADFAQQLTAFESEIFQRITYQECYDFGLSKEDMKVRSPNIFMFVENFNKIGELVTSTVLRENQATHRRKCIEFFLKVSKELLALNNYNATMEIISALGSSSISRLKKTWTDKLEQQFKPFTEYLEKNFSKLRTEMTSAVPPLLPYVGIFMKDLMMIEEGNEDYTAPNFLNWQKMKLQADVILKIFTIKRKKSVIPKSNSIRNFIERGDWHITEDEAFKKSLELEPRK